MSSRRYDNDVPLFVIALALLVLHSCMSGCAAPPPPSNFPEKCSDWPRGYCHYVNPETQG